MVDLTGLPRPPARWPDPRTCQDFPEWLQGLKEFSRITQREIADAAGASPQAVTKWLRGGAIEVERLVRLAEWSGAPYNELRRLVDEPKLRMLHEGLSIGETPGSYMLAMAAKSERDDFWSVFRRLSPENREVVYELATTLLSKQPRQD